MSNKHQENQPKITSDKAASNNITNIVDLTKGLDVKNLVKLISLSETAERYQDMCKLCKQMVLMKAESKQPILDVDERNLLSVAYKNTVGPKRFAWRELNKALSDIDSDNEAINKYKKIIENELEIECLEIVDLLTKYLCNDNDNEFEGDSQAFYLKMVGDYYRYLAELDLNITFNKKYDELAEEYYVKSMDIAENKLEENHPTRLGLALNFSVCCYEILKQPQRAIDINKKAFNAAINKLDNLSGPHYNAHTLILQLLADNAVKWTKEESKKISIKLINGYIRKVKEEYVDLIIPHEMNEIVIGYYFYCDADMTMQQ